MAFTHPSCLSSVCPSLGTLRKQSSGFVERTHQSRDPKDAHISLVTPKDTPINLVISKDTHISLVIPKDAHISLVISKDAHINLVIPKDANISLVIPKDTPIRKKSFLNGPKQHPLTYPRKGKLSPNKPATKPENLSVNSLIPSRNERLEIHDRWRFAVGCLANDAAKGGWASADTVGRRTHGGVRLRETEREIGKGWGCGERTLEL
ncbi:hypothetical protein E6C27_scaffold332G00030 [Cucumis melo var. makuwa]|uniref:NBS-LRR type resistance protein n=1 Tax=Cucumis melo var. makuwa TaxID=1194695 RepID=A0A5A7TPG8_CUCMM|nr:hypothetical protein E6C27_scaffold332G00030 [Cucumis melo var. makuwa]